MTGIAINNLEALESGGISASNSCYKKVLLEAVKCDAFNHVERKMW